MTPPERSEWTVTEASKRQFAAALLPPSKHVLVDVCAPISLRRDFFFCFYSAVAIPVFSSCAGLCMRQGRAHA
jgi:hypothetical protein